MIEKGKNIDWYGSIKDIVTMDHWCPTLVFIYVKLIIIASIIYNTQDYNFIQSKFMYI